MSAPLKFGDIVERQGNLVRLQGVSGWLNATDLVPCKCGNQSFELLRRQVGKYQRERLVCQRCVCRHGDERELGTVIMNGGQ